MGGIAIDRHAARPTPDVDAINGHHAWPGVAKLKQVGRLVVDGFFCGSEVTHHFVKPVVHRGSGKLALIVPFDLWIEQFGRDPVGVLRPESGPLIEGV